MAVIDLGGGRRHPSDKIDHSVGFSDLLPLGTQVEKGQPIATVHAADETSAAKAAAGILATYRIASGKPGLPAVISGRV
jgi:thymidine phosphorylase